MLALQTLEDINLLVESVELECKLAQWQDGNGEVPKDFWPTYAAMANAHGGVVLLGVREKAGVFSVAGLNNPANVRADLFNTLNNRAKVSVNLLSDADVLETRIDGKFRGTGYFMPFESLPTPEQVFVGPAFPIVGRESMRSSSEYSEPTSEHLMTEAPTHYYVRASDAPSTPGGRDTEDHMSRAPICQIRSRGTYKQ